jgi:hypothetical protein
MKIDYKYKHLGNFSAIVECGEVNKCTVCMCQNITIAINGRKASVRCNKCGKDSDDTICGEGNIKMKWFVEQMILMWNEENEPIDIVDAEELQKKAMKLRESAEEYDLKADYFNGGSEWTMEFDVRKLKKRTYIRFYYTPHNTPIVKYGWIDSELLGDNHYDVQVDDGYGGARGMTANIHTITAIANLKNGKNKPDFKI